MPPSPRQVYRRNLDFLYTRQGFDATRLFVASDGSSFRGCPCYYCGNPATTHDHVYPLVALYALYGVEDLPPTHLLVIVPCCQECNALLHSSVFPTMAARKRYLKRRLRQRYKRLLALPSWHPQELLTLGPGLRAYVEIGLAQQENLHQRLSW